MDLCVSPVVVPFPFPFLSRSLSLPFRAARKLGKSLCSMAALHKNKDIQRSVKIQPLSVWVRRERCQVQCHCCLARGSCRWQETLHLFGKFGCPSTAGAAMMIQEKYIFVVYCLLKDGGSNVAQKQKNSQSLSMDPMDLGTLSLSRKLPDHEKKTCSCLG